MENIKYAYVCIYTLRYLICLAKGFTRIIRLTYAKNYYIQLKKIFTFARIVYLIKL